LTGHSQVYGFAETSLKDRLPQVATKNAAMPKVLQIKAEPLTADAYRPFGQVIGIDEVQMEIVNDRFPEGTITMKCQPFRRSGFSGRNVPLLGAYG
jgi:hypothetical protein